MPDDHIARCMPAVAGLRERLAVLQGMWDSLSLLSHLSGDGLDMAGTRQGFETLATDLIANLGDETFKKTTLKLKAEAQVAVDIMVRNLFERAADIGFLCADDDVRAYLRDFSRADAPDGEAGDNGAEARSRALRSRFEEYVLKYSVYHNIILLRPDGGVALQLDGANPVTRSSDPLIAETLATEAGYVETFRKTDLLPGLERGLIYSYRVCEGTRALGVLCLCFRFGNEVEGIFNKLRDEQDWTVLALLDAGGTVIGSSDAWQLPVGAHIAPVFEEDGRVIRFAGREYLAITRRTHGYQGYAGPGWYGHAMIPLQHAFDETDGARSGAGIPRAGSAVFGRALQDIPRKAENIQRDLNRAVWNGNVRLGARSGSDNSFSKVLLREIGEAGRKTRQEFEHSIEDLQRTVVSGILHDSHFFASLAVDILDRNLYERANDCRWWALNGTLIECLGGAQDAGTRATAVLKQINGLYTVYHNLVLFDTQCRVVAVSNPEYARMVGTVIGEPWARQTLALPDSQSYTESPFTPSAFYGGAHTLVYGAALRNAQGRTVGGIGIVFDTTPQLQAMLQDALPRTPAGATPEGCIGLFVDYDGHVLAATDRYQPGERAALDPAFLAAGREGDARLVALEDRWYAVGLRGTAGYREYPGLQAVGAIMIPLGQRDAAVGDIPAAPRRAFTRAAHGVPTVEIATFQIGAQWLGLCADQVVEAVETTGLCPAPGAGPGFAGYLMYRENPLPVVDLGRLISSTEAGMEAAAARRNIVVIKAGASQQLYGLLVHELDSIPEVAADWIVPAPYQVRTSIFADRMVREEKADGPLLFILDPEQVLKRVQAAVGNQAEGEIEARVA